MSEQMTCPEIEVWTYCNKHTDGISLGQVLPAMPTLQPEHQYVADDGRHSLVIGGWQFEDGSETWSMLLRDDATCSSPEDWQDSASLHAEAAPEALQMLSDTPFNSDAAFWAVAPICRPFGITLPNRICAWKAMGFPEFAAISGVAYPELRLLTMSRATGCDYDLLATHRAWRQSVCYYLGHLSPLLVEWPWYSLTPVSQQFIDFLRTSPTSGWEGWVKSIRESTPSRPLNDEYCNPPVIDIGEKLAAEVREAS